MKVYPDLSQVSEFIVVAATLLDMKAARLLPVDETSEEDLEALEARDVLFARLLQYRAFKEASQFIARRFRETDGFIARNVDDPITKAMPVDLVRSFTNEAFAAIAADALRPVQTDATFHLHDTTHPVGPEARTIMSRLRRQSHMDFEDLISDTDDLHRVVSRFLAILILYRDGFIDFEQSRFGASLMISLVASRAAEFTDDVIEHMNY